VYQYVLDASGRINILIDDKLLERQEELYSNYKLFLEKLALKKIVNIDEDLAAQYFHEPSVSTLFHLTNGSIARPDAKKLIENINKIGSKNPVYSKAKINVRQDPIYLPMDAIGETQFRPVELSNEDIDDLIRKFEILQDLFGKDWADFMAPVRVITIVSVPGYDDLPYFSGSGSDIWGAIHIAKPTSQSAYAEMLTHEAAHHWCHLVEDLGILSDNCWAGDIWPSPWRNEPRPLGGVIHGVSVFAAAAVTLCSLKLYYEKNLDNRSYNVDYRIAYLIAQVEEGLRICNKSGMIAANGQKLMDAALEGLNSIYAHIPNTLTKNARDLLDRRMQAKYDLWRSQNLVFNTHQ
jgi:hypothetical protein